MKALMGNLDPTATFITRRWVWLPTAAFGGDGVLTVTQVHKSRLQVETDVYGVEEIQPDHLRCRSFLIVNLTDDTQEQPYRCTVGPVERCSCEGGRMGFRRASCKHKDALKAVIAAGAVPVKQLQGA